MFPSKSKAPSLTRHLVLPCLKLHGQGECLIFSIVPEHQKTGGIMDWDSEDPGSNSHSIMKPWLGAGVAAVVKTLPKHLTYLENESGSSYVRCDSMAQKNNNLSTPPTCFSQSLLLLEILALLA